MICTKTGPDVKHQFDWWTKVPDAVRPRKVRYDRMAGTVSYEYVEGITPISWEIVHEWAKGTLWGEPERAPYYGIGRAAYCTYVDSCVKEVENAYELPDLTPVNKHIIRDRLTPARTCHGDLTLKNCVLTIGGRFVFLDPGHDRGLRCREIDEAKLMQSLDGFDVIYRGHCIPEQVPKFPARPVHWALLVTHYVRLLRHVKWEPARRFAVKRINEITELLK